LTPLTLTWRHRTVTSSRSWAPYRRGAPRSRAPCARGAWCPPLVALLQNRGAVRAISRYDGWGPLAVVNCLANTCVSHDLTAEEAKAMRKERAFATLVECCSARWPADVRQQAMAGLSNLLAVMPAEGLKVADKHGLLEVVRDAGNRALPSSSLAEYALKVGQAIDMARSVEGVKAMLMEGMLPVPPSPSGAPTPGRDGTGEAAAVPPAADECANCRTRREEGPPSARLKKCGSCKAVAYCSSQCQRQHWKAAHKAECPELKVARELRIGVAAALHNRYREGLATSRVCVVHGENCTCGATDP